VPLDFEISACKLENVDTTDVTNTLEEGDVEVGAVVFGSPLLHVYGLGCQVGYLLVYIYWINGVELLNLSLVFVKIQNDWLVISLA
jgi:hypothetical protein